MKNAVLKCLFISTVITLQLYVSAYAEEINNAEAERPPAKEEGNMFANPGFESDQPGRNKLYITDKWRLYFAKPKELVENGIEISLDKKTFHSGLQSLKIKSMKKAFPVSLCQVNLPVKAGDNCELSVWSKSLSDFPGKLPIRLTVWCLGKFENDKKIKSIIRVFDSTGEWQQFKSEITIPEGTEKAHAILEFKSRKGKGVPGILWFDDAVFKIVEKDD
ncbi:MAG: carbohydrate binding domain-containing protein [Planctomycetota bacterium]|jgi:hypothetical protein